MASLVDFAQNVKTPGIGNIVDASILEGRPEYFTTFKLKMVNETQQALRPLLLLGGEC